MRRLALVVLFSATSLLAQSREELLRTPKTSDLKPPRFETLTADALRGAIKVYSRRNYAAFGFNDSSVTVRLPAVATPAAHAKPSGDGEKTLTLRGGLRILLVEDHVTTARVLGRLLREADYDVHTAATLTDARAAVLERDFDLLISDLGLPDGSGLELMRELAASHGLKGIALSGYGMDEDIRRSRDVGFATHLTKPVDFRKLQAAISQVTGR